jgi:hypothetical protein
VERLAALKQQTPTVTPSMVVLGQIVKVKLPDVKVTVPLLIAHPIVNSVPGSTLAPLALEDALMIAQLR